MKDTLSLLTGNANRPLALDISKILNVPITEAEVSKFSDGEIRVEIFEQVRGKEVFIIQPTCSPVNDTIFELLLLIDAARRAKAKSICCVVPYFGYSRQDRKPELTRVPITSKLVADMLKVAGCNYLVTVDIHAQQIVGFFDFFVDSITAIPVLVADMYSKYSDANPIIVSPDVGGVARARKVAKQLQNSDLAIIDKRRPKANESEVMNIIGDVRGKTCILFDDMVDTAGTLCKAADALKNNGASAVVAYCTHPVLSGNAYINIINSSLDELIVTDTIPLDTKFNQIKKIRVISVAQLLAEIMIRIHTNQSVSSIYID